MSAVESRLCFSSRRLGGREPGSLQPVELAVALLGHEPESGALGVQDSPNLRLSVRG